jgi:hypothetical protein
LIYLPFKPGPPFKPNETKDNINRRKFLLKFLPGGPVSPFCPGNPLYPLSPIKKLFLIIVFLIYYINYLLVRRNQEDRECLLKSLVKYFMSKLSIYLPGNPLGPGKPYEKENNKQ